MSGSRALLFVGLFAACGTAANQGSDGSISNDGSHDGAVATDGPPSPMPDLGPIVAPQPLSPFIVVDQFGYRPVSEKIAVLRNPKTGFDVTGGAFAPGPMYAVIDAHSGAKLFEAAPAAWSGGATDSSSGDQAWWFDFSTVTAPGDYFVLDESQAVRSDVFHISDDVYRDVLAQSVRMFFYQRDGFAKDAQHAGADWADGASHLGANQDLQCVLYSNSTAPKDLHGGWYDAGDQNKYTNWGASDVIILLRAYRENPGAFRDDYNIPESGNGIADVLDEARWELDWIVRMQNTDGSVLSIVGQDGAPAPNSLPSLATGPCKYGPANTSAALSGAAVFALGAMTWKTMNPTYSADLQSRAVKAWTWALANPNVTFFNAQNGVGAGEQETDAAGRASRKLEAAEFLFELTGDTQYRDYFDANYGASQLAGGFVDMFAVEDQDTLLGYTKAANATASVVQKIQTQYKAGLASGNNLGAVRGNKDPYLAYTYVYVWGSNQVKADQGNVFYDSITFAIDPASDGDSLRGAERYVHYVHGVNPLQLVYLSNMGNYGAIKSVTRFYHSWFGKGSKWDAVGVSMYGPPPGYLVGGPNPSYTWDGCCPGGCGGIPSCGAGPPSPPVGQPPQKSYKDFNDNWPLDSWAVTEPDDGYQAKYVRLLSKFVK